MYWRTGVERKEFYHFCQHEDREKDATERIIGFSSSERVRPTFFVTNFNKSLVKSATFNLFEVYYNVWSHIRFNFVETCTWILKNNMNANHIKGIYYYYYYIEGMHNRHISFFYLCTMYNIVYIYRKSVINIIVNTQHRNRGKRNFIYMHISETSKTFQAHACRICRKNGSKLTERGDISISWQFTYFILHNKEWFCMLLWKNKTHTNT